MIKSKWFIHKTKYLFGLEFGIGFFYFTIDDFSIEINFMKYKIMIGRSSPGLMPTF